MLSATQTAFKANIALALHRSGFDALVEIYDSQAEVEIPVKHDIHSLLTFIYIVSNMAMYVDVDLRDAARQPNGKLKLRICPDRW